jgi:hypothetical protein
MKNFHGITSMLLFIASTEIAGYALFNYSALLGSAYILILILGFSFISLTYCIKCPIRAKCNHIIPGLVSKLRKYNSTDYTRRDIITTLITLLVIIGFPQYWMFKSFSLFIVFWIVISITLVEIFFFVCSKCSNKKCALCRADQIHSC